MRHLPEIVSSSDVVAEVKFLLRQIAKLDCPEASRVKQLQVIERWTGVPARRIKDYWHGVIARPSGAHLETFRNVRDFLRERDTRPDKKDHKLATEAHP